MVVHVYVHEVHALSNIAEVEDLPVAVSVLDCSVCYSLACYIGNNDGSLILDVWQLYSECAIVRIRINQDFIAYHATSNHLSSGSAYLTTLAESITTVITQVGSYCVVADRER